MAMRMLAVLVLVVPAAMFAQRRQAIGQPQGALGGIYAGQGMSRPLGGIAPPTYRSSPPVGKPGGPRFIAPVYYVPNAFGTTFASEAEASHYDSNYHPVPAPYLAPGMGVQFANSAPIAPPQTVIVNHYYNKDEQKPIAANSDAATNSDYYLVAYKNRNVIAAQAYWLDGETLHYVTSANVHNQASLALIDLDMTKRLNADREVPFSIPSK